MRTFIGELIFRFKDDASGKAKQTAQAVGGSVEQLERAAKRLNSMPWGGRFTAQLDKLGLAAGDIEKLRVSWERLHQSMAARNLSKAAARNEIENFKVATLGHFAAIQSASQQHFKDMEKRTRTFSTNLQTLMKPALIAMGGYTGAYMVAQGTRAGITASSERRREVFRQDMAGISKRDQDKLFDQSEAVGHKYPSIPITGIMEMARSAFSVMGDAERAGAILERMAESLVVMQSARGPDAAAQQLIGLIRGLDNLGANKDGQIGIDQMNEMIDAATRAAQVDPDFDPQGFFNFARATKTAGPALSMDFLTRAPVYIQDLGSGTTGNSLAMGFKAFVLEAVGSAGGKKYLEERDRLGIRKNGQLVDKDLFGSDPDEWVLKYLVPALRKDGVDLNNNNQISAAVGKLSGNSTATGFLNRILTQHEQTSRWLELMKGAMGPDAAINARFEDPFVGLAAFKSSMENLASALVPIDTINAGLNSLADVINRLQKAWDDGDPLAKAGIAAAGAGTAYGAWKTASAIWGLITAGTNLNAAAVSLQAAAVSLGGAGSADMLGGGGGKKKGGGLFGAGWFTPVTVGVAGTTAVAALADAYKDYRRDHPEIQGRDDAKTAQNVRALKAVLDAIVPSRGNEDVLAGQRAASGGGNPLQNAVDNATRLGGGPVIAEAQHVGQEVKDALSVTAKPTIDTSSLEQALSLANQFKATLRELMANVNSVSAQSSSAMSAATQRARQQADAEIRRSFSDYGVAP